MKLEFKKLQTKFGIVITVKYQVQNIKDTIQTHWMLSWVYRAIKKEQNQDNKENSENYLILFQARCVYIFWILKIVDIGLTNGFALVIYVKF